MYRHINPLKILHKIRFNFCRREIYLTNSQKQLFEPYTWRKSNTTIRGMDDFPTNDECEDAIRQFAEITETDEAFAHFILQNEKFDLDKALTRYYADEDPEKIYQEFQVQEEQKAEQSEKVSISKQSQSQREELPGELTFFTWNVDGLERKNLSSRFNAVLYVIAKANPEVIFLQEMIPELIPPLKKLMEPMYSIVSDEDQTSPYFCVSLVSKNIKITYQSIIKFENTGMFRSMICIEGQWQKLKLNLINTHLESLKESSLTRKDQLRQCMEKLNFYVERDPPSGSLSIFAGDLNLRDSEAPNLDGKLVKDAWVAAGSPKDNQYTWDTRRNDNTNVGYAARCRFDRLFFAGPYRSIDFQLQGLQRIRGINCFPSDHFAIYCKFKNPELEDSTEK